MGTQTSHLEQQISTGRLLDPRARQRHTGACLFLTGVGAALGLLSLLPQAPRLLWNFTESLPTGLYIISAREPVKGDLVAILPAGSARETLSAAHALPAGRLLLKRLAAAKDDTVCRSDATVTINGVEAAIALRRSHNGQPLPAWSGCRVLGARDIVVLAPHPLSFDSRYFGQIDADQVVGIATGLLTFPTDGGA